MQVLLISTIKLLLSMNKKTTLPIGVIALASILLVSGFGLSSSAHAATGSTSTIVAKVPSTLNNHSVIFKVCAGDQVMRAPEVIIRSDSAVKNVKLNKVISANTCKTTATTIQAFDADTIKIKKVDKSKINTMITAAERKLANIKSEISATNIELEELLASLPGGNNPIKPANVKKINDLTTELSDLRKQLKDARSDYYRLLYVIRG